MEEESKWKKHEKPNSEEDDYYGVIKLIGKKICKIFIDANAEYIRFVTDQGEKLDYFTAPDCCSSGWFEHIKGVNELPFVVKEIHTISLGEVIPTKSEVDMLYGVKFKIEAKHSDEFFIEFRNSSNGYYGSTFRFCDQLPEYETIIWSELTEDI